VLDDFDEKIAMLAGYPEAGRTREDLRPGLRQFPSGSYLIFYTLNVSELEVRRVMHGARDIVEEMFEDD
jgi:plasmid stabilization system protein ParE